MAMEVCTIDQNTGYGSLRYLPLDTCIPETVLQRRGAISFGSSTSCLTYPRFELCYFKSHKRRVPYLNFLISINSFPQDRRYYSDDHGTRPVMLKYCLKFIAAILILNVNFELIENYV
ncbi:hypothetical protein KUTeg_017011 [Tegillarca granosa]|uniref:Uncharacterized protein n=1 Tax=Tegillarca granosa TaxID=220873 RepID=A0ABQ9EQ36_TEGGR|nr:hypothetical protein KUTeg_017011 [Tegillarca granosa]